MPKGTQPNLVSGKTFGNRVKQNGESWMQGRDRAAREQNWSHPGAKVRAPREKGDK